MADINLGMALLALFVFGLLIRLIEAVSTYLPLIIGVGVVVFVAWKIFSIYRAAALEAADFFQEQICAACPAALELLAVAFAGAVVFLLA